MTDKKRTKPRKRSPTKRAAKTVVPDGRESPRTEPLQNRSARRLTVVNPIVLKDISGKRIAIAVRPDGTAIVGREGAPTSKNEPTISNPIVLKGLSGRMIAIAIQPDGSALVGREAAPKAKPQKVPEKTTPESLRIVLEGTIGEERNEENPFGGDIKPEDINPNVKHIDPRLLQPMVMRIGQDGERDETPPKPGDDAPSKRRPKVE
jgi:hypothetical protein